MSPATPEALARTRIDAMLPASGWQVQANLKRYRAAVLKAACEGRLVPTEAELARKEGRTFESGEALLAGILAECRKNWEGRGQIQRTGVCDRRESAVAPTRLGSRKLGAVDQCCPPHPNPLMVSCWAALRRKSPTRNSLRRWRS